MGPDEKEDLYSLFREEGIPPMNVDLDKLEDKMEIGAVIRRWGVDGYSPEYL